MNTPETAVQRLAALERNSVLITREKKQKEPLPKEPLTGFGHSDEHGPMEQSVS